MKTLTITLHSIDNCGSCLQAYALQQFLLQNGIENEVIDYRPSYGRNNGRPLRHFIKKIVFGNAMKRRQAVFEGFVRDYLRLTPETYYKYSKLAQAGLQADVFITGSDQVWNDSFPCGRDEAFYLPFARSGKRISYAASAGRRLQAGEEIRALCRRIQGFDAVSVREKSTADALKAEGIDAAEVCDPVLLHDRGFYDSLIKSNEQGDYILVYLIPKSELLDRILKQLKEKLQCRVIYVGSFLNRCECDINLTDAGPQEFVNLIAHAAYVVAGSFHATVFSCIFHKEFVTLPYANNDRMTEFLDKAGLRERFIEEGMPLPVESIVWDKADEAIREMREVSGEWLMGKF